VVVSAARGSAGRNNPDSIAWNTSKNASVRYSLMPRANTLAMASPMPLPQPVAIATLFSNLMVFLHSSKNICMCSIVILPGFGSLPLQLHLPLPPSSNSGVPLISLIFPVPALPTTDAGQGVDQFYPHNILRLLVPQLALKPQTKRRAVRNIQWYAIELVS
jgi:hypothetical protein